MYEVLGPPRRELLDGRALMSYEAGFLAARRTIAVFGLVWAPEVEAAYEAGKDADGELSGWFAQGWDDHYSRAMNAVAE